MGAASRKTVTTCISMRVGHKTKAATGCNLGLCMASLLNLVRIKGHSHRSHSTPYPRWPVGGAASTPSPPMRRLRTDSGRYALREGLRRGSDSEMVGHVEVVKVLWTGVPTSTQHGLVTAQSRRHTGLEPNRPLTRAALQTPASAGLITA